MTPKGGDMWPLSPFFKSCEALVVIQYHDCVMLECLRETFDNLLHLIHFALKFAQVTNDIAISVFYPAHPRLKHGHAPFYTTQALLHAV